MLLRGVVVIAFPTTRPLGHSARGASGPLPEDQSPGEH